MSKKYLSTLLVSQMTMLRTQVLNVLRYQQGINFGRNAASISTTVPLFPVQGNTVVNQEWESAKPFKEIPKVSAFKILLGLMNPKKRATIDKVAKSGQKESIFKFNVFGTDRVFIEDPEMAKILMGYDGKYPIEPGVDPIVYYRSVFRKDLFSETKGLVGAHGPEWGEFRSLVNPSMMRPKAAMYYIPVLDEISTDFVDLVESKKDENDEVDIREYIFGWSLESISAIFLNTRIGAMDPNLPEDSDSKQFIKAIGQFLGPDLNEITMGPPIWKYIQTPAFRRWDKAQMTMYEITKKFVDKAVLRCLKDGLKKGDEASVLEKLIDKCGPESQVPVVMAQDAMIAGVDNTGTSGAFMLLDLAMYPEYQDRLFKEITDAVGDGPITASSINQMPYLKACFKETMRLHPPVIGFSRLTQVDMVLGGYRIPKDTIVIYYTQDVMKSPDHFTDPETFNPERWLRDSSERSTAHPFSALPFGHGPRVCPGKRFAELEAYILAIRMLQRFRLEYHHGPVGMKTYFLSKPDKEMFLKLIDR